MWDSLIINPFVNALLFIYTVVGKDFGIAIILFTLVIRLITYPLTMQQLKSSQAMTEMQKSKKWQDMQKKYKDDKEKLAQEQMALYKEMGVNPFSSCLPTLIQFPIIIGLYQAVMRTLASSPLQLLDLTKHIYPFLLKYSSLIPLDSKWLWMDLGQPERLHLSFLPFGIPVLAIVVVITTYIQSKMMPTPSANPGDQGSQMTKAMNLYMPFLMGYMGLTLASGLALYFVASNLFGIAQYAIMYKPDWKKILSFK